jgi:hypothetical protein
MSALRIAFVVPAIGVAGLLLVLGAAIGQQQPADDLTAKQLNMFAAEAQFFAALAKQQKEELDKLKASPCEKGEAPKP